jgi:hypothetical protein
MMDIVRRDTVGCVAAITLRREEADRRLQSGGDTEQALNELRLRCRVSSVQPFHLPLLHHVRGFNFFQGSLGGVEGAEALHRSPPPPYGSMVLPDDFVEILYAPQLTIPG